LPNELISFGALAPEKLIKSISEEQHASTNRDALRKAAPVDIKEQNLSWKVLQSLVRAVETAYLVNFSEIELLPKPKVNILSRGLAQLAAKVT
jgi:hypothetical protein